MGVTRNVTVDEDDGVSDNVSVSDGDCVRLLLFSREMVCDFEAVTERLNDIELDCDFEEVSSEVMD